MKRHRDDRYENGDTPSREVARRYRAVVHEDDHNGSVALLHYKGGEDEYLGPLKSQHVH